MEDVLEKKAIIEKNKAEIIEQIKKNLKSEWKIDRISKINLSILKLAIYEIKYKELYIYGYFSIFNLFLF